MFKVTNLKRGGGGEIRFPGHWLTEDGLEKELGNKVRAEGRKEGPFKMAKACVSLWNLNWFLGL